MFPYIYTILLTIIYIFSTPFLLLLSLKDKYKRSIPARFFLYKNPPFKKENIYHFHACSFGEVRALKPLIENFEEVNISVITQTGFEEAKRYKNSDVRFLPFEHLLWFWLKPQKALVVLEAELWYLLFYISKRRGAKTFLLNARISDKSYKKYRRFSWFYRKIFENVDYVFAQSALDKKRLESLGAKNVDVVGNIKLLNRPTITKEYKKPNRFVTVVASTHDPEEEIIVTAWIMSSLDGILIVVPRHPERFDEVDELLSDIAKRENLRYKKISESNDLDADIILVDKMGELNNFYKIADLVILGGSFIDGIGGHNPIEPAFFNKPIISGPYYFNQKETYLAVKDIKIVNPNDLTKVLDKKDFTLTKIVSSIDINKIIKKIKS